MLPELVLQTGDLLLNAGFLEFEAPENGNEDFSSKFGHNCLASRMDGNVVNLARSSRSNPTAFEAVSFELNLSRMEEWRSTGIVRTRHLI